MGQVTPIVRSDGPSKGRAAPRPSAVVFDDQHEIGVLTVARLAQLGFDACSVTEKSKFIEALKSSHPDLMILDLSLGATDAIELFGWLKENRFAGHIILMSGHSSSVLDHARRLGEASGLSIAGVLHKPFHRQDLKAIIDTLGVAQACVLQPRSTEVDSDILRTALSQGWVEFWYQPKVEIRTGHIVGAECLARIRHPDRGILDPASFLSSASEDELYQLTMRALDDALGRADKLRIQGRSLIFSVNISGRTLAKPGLLEEIVAISRRHTAGLPIIFEITETDVLDDMVAAQAFATRLILHNFQISIDDFGHGYATFDRLRIIPFTELKLDRSVVNGCSRDQALQSICKAAVELARGFGAKVVAEGVEHAEDFETLRALGFDIVQGYLFAKPMPFGEFVALPAQFSNRISLTKDDAGPKLSFRRDPDVASSFDAKPRDRLEIIAPETDATPVNAGAAPETDGGGVVVRSLPLTNKTASAKSAATFAAEKAKREALLKQTEKLANVGGWELDLQSRKLTWTDGVFAIYDLPVGNPPSYLQSLRLFSPSHRRNLRTAIAEAIRNAMPFDIELRLTTGAKISKWVRVRGECEGGAGKVTKVYGYIADISVRKRSDDYVWKLANRDPLTGLANRAQFQVRLTDAMTRARQDGSKVALVLLDIDHLKEVNDTLGHSVGDSLLRSAAERLKSSIRKNDIAARLGGDEFALILCGLAESVDGLDLVESIQSRLREPHSFSGHRLSCGASVGIAIFPDHDETAEGLLKSADVALYAAKATGRGSLVLFTPEMRLTLLRKVSARMQTRTAIDENQIVPYYQPQVSLTTQRVVGFEALLRWNHPTKGILPPSALAEAFDDGELCAAIGEKILKQVLSDMRLWLAKGLQFGRVAINAAPLELARRDYATNFLRQVEAAGINPSMLAIEVTENALTGRGFEQIAAVLRELNAAGVSLSLDDFGIGYGSLAHLRHLPIDTLKIDPSFIRDMRRQPDAKAIVLALIKLASGLNLKLIAEGIETFAQASFLREEGCDIVQGLLFSEALPAADIPGLIAKLNAAKPIKAAK